MKKKINIGVIGLGVGIHHLNTYMTNKNCNVMNVCDFNEKKLIKIKKKYNNSFEVTKYSDDIINNKDIKLVSIASYDNYHYEHIKKCIKNNKHIFVEKPLCLNFKELFEIKKLLKKNPKIKISSNFVLRTAPIFINLKKNIRKFGNIFNIEANYLWGRKSKFNGWRKDMPYYSKILGAGVHMVDLICWILNQKPVSVYAVGNRVGTKDIKIRFNTFASIFFKFRNGLVLKVSANGPCLHPHFHEIFIYGDLRTLKLTTQGLFEVNKKFNKNLDLRNIKKIYPRKDLRSNILKNFINNIVFNKKNSISKNQIFNVMSACLAAEESIKKNKVIEIKY
jgi:predicted dehydrogenase